MEDTITIVIEDGTNIRNNKPYINKNKISIEIFNIVYKTDSTNSTKEILDIYKENLNKIFNYVIEDESEKLTANDVINKVNERAKEKIIDLVILDINNDITLVNKEVFIICELK